MRDDELTQHASGVVGVKLDFGQVMRARGAADPNHLHHTHRKLKQLAEPNGANPINRAAYAFLADRIEGELRSLKAWTDGAAPEGQVAGAFGAPNLSFSQWIQFTLLPRLRAITDGADPPTGSSAGTMAIREYDGLPQADRVVDLLIQLDRLVEYGEDPPGMGPSSGNSDLS